MIGIYEMGGIGKTTIARAVYDLISCEFEWCSFLSIVREISEKDGIIPLQKQLLSETLMERDVMIYNEFGGIEMIKKELQCRKVLVVIDDVVHVNQLNKLVGKHSWFGLGSRIIITTRDKHLLLKHRVDKLYRAEALNDDESLQLFSLKAFDTQPPDHEYVELTKDVLKYADGLPLALHVLCSFLFGRSRDEWRRALERLNKDSENEILDVLEISFNGLKEIEKQIFLYIACFLKGKIKDYVRVLDDCDFDPVIEISVLIDKSLITVLHDNKLWLHNLLQEMGQQIVTRKSSEEPGNCSRL
ncbi:Disease resistance protein [Melia azedarach]|uniref:Disease resistance protein n=1 Tax=Melia azedarach TaxID=155640 RepID=A0ACC1XRK4_MELAZ|nr:Disease resistance protein [Melia azedarach]